MGHVAQGKGQSRDAIGSVTAERTGAEAQDTGRRRVPGQAWGDESAPNTHGTRGVKRNPQEGLLGGREAGITAV